jgi:hypothetical protein
MTSGIISISIVPVFITDINLFNFDPVDIILLLFSIQSFDDLLR